MNRSVIDAICNLFAYFDRGYGCFFLDEEKIRHAETDRDQGDFVVCRDQERLWMQASTVVQYLLWGLPTVLGMILITNNWKNGVVLLWVCVGISVFLWLGLFLEMRGSVWRLTVTDQTIVITSFFGKKETCSFADITKVTLKTSYRFQKACVYSYQKKLFSANASYIGYQHLLKRFNEEQVMPKTDSTSFVVRRPKHERWIGMITTLCLTSIMLTSPPGNTVTWSEYLVLASSLCLSVYITLIGIIWRITVTNQTIVITSLFAKKRRCTFADITHVTATGIRNDYLSAYFHQKKLFLIRPNFPGYDVLWERLQQL